MFQFPPFPSWDALHPAISHFPIALLVTAPVLLLLGLIRPQRREVLLSLSLWILVAGTVGVYLSAATGDASKILAPQTPEVLKAIDVHESAGSMARAVFTGMAVLLAALLYVPRLMKRSLSPRTEGILAAVLLLAYAAAILILLNAAHSGGLLVHKLGVHAKIT
jgi:uncharacterized membrane protein